MIYFIQLYFMPISVMTILLFFIDHFHIRSATAIIVKNNKILELRFS